jgi:hypothetical protein
VASLFRRRAPTPPAVIASGERARDLGLTGSAEGPRQNRRPPAKRGAPGETSTTDIVWTHYSTNGPVWYAVQSYAKQLSRLRLFVAQGNPSNFTPVDETDPRLGLARAVLERVRDPAGGIASLLYRYGQLMFATGDARLVYTLNPPADAPKGQIVPRAECFEAWDMLSGDELEAKRDSDRWLRRRTPGATPDEFIDIERGGVNAQPYIDNEGRPVGLIQTYRFWRPHPRYSGLADSPMRAALGEAEELAALSRAIRSKARQRSSAAGAFILPSEIRGNPADPEYNAADPSSDPVVKSILEAVYSGYEDEYDPANVVPIIIRPPAEYAPAIRMQMFHEPGEKYPEAALRGETLERLAISLDMPKERLLGTGDINHWGQWHVTEDEWRAHGQPIARMMVEDWTTGYFRPTLTAPAAEGGAGFTQDEADGLFIWFDASEVVIPADRTNDAVQAHDRGYINDQAARRAGGWKDSDAPSPDAPNTNPSVAQLWGGPYTGEQATTAAPAAAAPASQPTQNPGDTNPAPPATAAAAGTASYLLGVTDTVVLRMREAAGARLRNRAKNAKTPADVRGLVEAHAGEPNERLAAVLGERVVQTTLNGHAPLAASVLVDNADEPLCLALERLGVSSVLTAQLRGAARQWAAQTLYDPTPGQRPGLVVDVCNAIAGELERAAA